jgi:hypothetical protein
MKKLNEKVAILFVACAFFFSSCAKEEIINGDDSLKDTSLSISKQEVTQPLQSKNGKLIFENEQHMFNELEKLAKMNLLEKVDWENKLNFRSLGSIEMLVNNAEVEKQEIFYKGLNPDLKISEYQAMGYKYEHTEIYKEYLASAVIEEEKDRDGNASFSLTMKNSGMANVLNDKGEVVIGNNLYRFSGYEGTIISMENNEVLNSFSIVSNEEKQNLFNWGQTCSCQNDGWQNTESNRRIFAQVVGYSLNSSSSTLIGSTFYAIARGQKKNFGTWSYSNSYNPVYRVSGSWTYDFSVQPNGLFNTITVSSTDNPPIIVLNDTDQASPLNNFVNGGNNYLQYLKPNGSWIIPSIYSVVNSINVHYSIDFSFSGGGSGHNIILSH